MRVLVTGGRTGYLGRHVVTAASADHDVVAVGSADADVRDRRAVDAMLERHAPDVVVHTAYVLMAGAMLGAAVMALAVARAVRGDPGVPRWLRPASVVVAVLSLASIFLAIIPLLVFLIWIAALGIIVSAQSGRPAVHAREVS